MKIRHLFNIISLLFNIYLVRLCILFTSKKKNNSENSVLFLECFPRENAGYHYRSEIWSKILAENGITSDVMTIIEERDTWNDLFYNHRFRFLKKSIWIRFRQIKRSKSFETVIVRRELLLFNDYGDLFLEKFLLKIHPNAILDFDDDIAASKQEPRTIRSLVGKLLQENGTKFSDTLKLYQRFIVASEYLASRTKEINSGIQSDQIQVIPTCVPYDSETPKQYNNNIPLVLGWIGSDYNYNLIESLYPVLEDLVQKHTFKLLVVGGEPIQDVNSFDLEFMPWTLDNEVELLKKMDIGLMPLSDSKGDKGKGAFKLIQYMGLGIVSIASPVTINNELIDHGKNSFLAENHEEWRTILDDLLSGKYDIAQMGRNARATIEAGYTFTSNKDLYINFIRS